MKALDFQAIWKIKGFFAFMGVMLVDLKLLQPIFAVLGGESGDKNAMNEMTGFSFTSKNLHDDAPDSMAMLADYLSNGIKSV